MDEREKLLMDIKYLKEFGEKDNRKLLETLVSKFLFIESKSYLVLVELLAFLKDEPNLFENSFKHIQQVLTMKAFRALDKYPPEDLGE